MTTKFDLGSIVKTPHIFIITGTPGAGKSSVAVALMQRFPFGLHIAVDDLREWVVSGIAHPVPIWTPETSRQFRLARRAAADITSLYTNAGFAVVIDDVISPPEADELVESSLRGYPIHKVLLRPALEVTLSRNTERANKPFDTFILDDVIRRLYASTDEHAYIRTGWHVIDSTVLSVTETVDCILTRVASDS